MPSLQARDCSLSSPCGGRLSLLRTPSLSSHHLTSLLRLRRKSPRLRAHWLQLLLSLRHRVLVGLGFSSLWHSPHRARLLLGFGLHLLGSWPLTGSPLALSARQSSSWLSPNSALSPRHGCPRPQLSKWPRTYCSSAYSLLLGTELHSASLALAVLSHLASAHTATSLGTAPAGCLLGLAVGLGTELQPASSRTRSWPRHRAPASFFSDSQLASAQFQSAIGLGSLSFGSTIAFSPVWSSRSASASHSVSAFSHSASASSPIAIDTELLILFSSWPWLLDDLPRPPSFSPRETSVGLSYLLYDT